MIEGSFCAETGKKGLSEHNVVSATTSFLIMVYTFYWSSTNLKSPYVESR